ncbi:MAG TPA: hypothetical protein VK563_14160 [Puia sp.]|nr:hypothetical protein [Puia sp.]
MNRFVRSFFIYLVVFVPVMTARLGVVAQANSYPYKVAQDRMLWHDNVDKEQKRLLVLGGGRTDSMIRLAKDENVNLQVTDALIRQVDDLQQQIEFDSTLNTNNKKKYLRGLEFLLRGFDQAYERRNVQPSIAPALIGAYGQAMQLDKKGLSIEPVIAENAYGIGLILIDCFLLPSENVGVKPSRILLTRKYCELHPGSILDVLRNNPDLPFADSLIIVAGHRDIRQLYDFAAASNPLGTRIRNSKDSLVHTVALMANSRSGQLYFPFLDNLIRGRITMGEIDQVKGDDLNYYRLLVRTRLDYAGRILPPARDTPLEMNALTEMLAKKGKEVFVREINALHTVDNPAIRFKILDPLTSAELYYLIVLSEDEIYTSSYLGVYDRIFQRMTNPYGDSLIMEVHGDYFRKFIKMAAAYNKLDHFLGTMDKQNAGTIMKSFIIHLEKANEEEAVDVADSYSSIFDKNPVLARYILDEVKSNYDKNVASNDKKGIIIYNLLKTLFASADTSSKTDLSAELGIPPVYSIDYNSLADDSGRVIQQVFFYGDQDKDGQNSFLNFMAMFRPRPGTKPEWKIAENPQWVTISSLKGSPVLIFANKPLLGEDDPDAKAQTALINYLFDHHMKPTIVIHRGHSYHVKYTIGQMPATARIVVLGSCGGYNNLSEVLKINEDAHIISSKQVGTKTVNEPILQAINNTLLAGKNIEWLPMWKELTARFQNDAVAKEKFDDYIPPYKNLGAIFIKAYRKAMEDEE